MNLASLFVAPRANPTQEEWEEITGIVTEIYRGMPSRFEVVKDLQRLAVQRHGHDEVAEARRTAPVDWSTNPIEALMAPPLSMPCDEATARLARAMDPVLATAWRFGKDPRWMAATVTWLSHKNGVRLACEMADPTINLLRDPALALAARRAVRRAWDWSLGYPVTEAQIREAAEAAFGVGGDPRPLRAAAIAAYSALNPVDVTLFRIGEDNAVSDVLLTLDWTMDATGARNEFLASAIRETLGELPSVDGWLRAQV